jgi:hypothetical protein
MYKIQTFLLCDRVYGRLQKLLMCLSHKRKTTYIDRLGEGHDAETQVES